MAFGLFKKRVPEPAVPATAAKAQTVADATETASAEGDSAKAILELLELELGAHDPPARARGQFGRRRRRGDGCDAFHHPPSAPTP